MRNLEVFPNVIVGEYEYARPCKAIRSFSTEFTPEDIVRRFLQESIRIAQSTRRDLRANYPALVKAQ